MLKNIIGAAIGSKLAPKNPTTGSAAGAALATAVPFVLSRFSIPAMLAVGAGGYLLKRHLDKKAESEQPPEQEGALKSKATGTRSTTAKKAMEADIINPPSGGVTNGSGKAPSAGPDA